MQKYNSKFKNNKDFDIKIRTYKYALAVIKLIDGLNKKRSSWVIGDQLLRAATSIGANIIEGQAASSKRDFVNFINHALKSANECKFWLGLLRDSQSTSAETINLLLEETNQLANILAKIVINSKNKF